MWQLEIWRCKYPGSTLLPLLSAVAALRYKLDERILDNLMVDARGSFMDSMQPVVEIWGKNDLTAQSHRFAFSQALMVAPLRIEMSPWIA